MKRLWFALVCPLLPLMSYAGSAPTDSASTTDFSIQYLGQVFGVVPGALDGTNGQGVVGGLFHVFNQGVMAVAAIWLVYTISQVLMMSATADHPQKSVKNWLLWFRVVLGFGLLIPGPSGYCMAQELMMQVVVQGAQLADRTWDYVLNYMQQGGQLFMTQPSSNKITSITQLDNFIGGNQGAPSTSSLAYRMFQSQVCMYLSNAYNQSNKATDQVAARGSKINYRMIALQPWTNAQGQLQPGMLYFPGYGDASTTMTVGDHGQPIGSIPQACGSFVAPKLPKQATSSQYQQAAAAMTQMALDMQPYAQQVASAMSSKAGNASSTPMAGGNTIFQSVVNYISLVQPIADFITNLSQSTNQNSAFVQQAQNEGWINAGGFYWDLLRWNASLATSHGDPTTVVPGYNVPSSAHFPSNLQDNISTALTTLGGSTWGDARTLAAQWVSGEKGSMQPMHQQVSGGVSFGFDMGIISSPMNDLVHTINALMTNTKVIAEIMPGFNNGNTIDENAATINPMVVSFVIGKTAVNQAGHMWMLLMEILMPFAVAAGVCDSANPGNVIFHATTAYVVPMVLAVAGMLFVSGAIMMLYAPLYPYLIFLFAVIGWFLSVIEAMVAAPLVAFGMSHPEGHDFMGRAEQALMLALGVFLRPALMVIGYVIGIVLVYVVSGFLNTVIGQVFMSTYHAEYAPNIGDAFDGAWSILGGSPGGNAGTQTGRFTDMLLIPVVLSMYAMIMLEATNQCFSAIHQLPDMVLRWIGAPVQQSDAQQHAQAIKGEISSSSQQAGRVADSFGSAVQGAGSALGRGKPPKDKDSNSGDPDGSGAPDGTAEGGGAAEGAEAGALLL